MSRLVSILLIILESISGFCGDAAADFFGGRFAARWDEHVASYLVQKAGNDTYTYETEIVVDNGRKLGFVLHGTKRRSSFPMLFVCAMQKLMKRADR